MENKRGLTKEEFGILWVFRENLHKNLTFEEVKRFSRKKSQHFIFSALKKLVHENIIILKKFGKRNVYTINLKNPLTVCYLSFLEEMKAIGAKHLPHKNINKLIENIKTPFFIFIIAGSYAEKKQKKESDMDVVIIVDDKVDKRVVLASLKEGELMIPEVHPYVFIKSEFLQMLLDKEENYGKEIERKKMIFYGAEIYYRIISEAIEYGYKG